MKQDIEKLQGTWSVTTLEIDGKRVDPVTFSGSKIVVSGHRFESLVDAASTPKNFSFAFTNGPERGNTNLGREFGTRPGNGHALEVLTRFHRNERPG